MVTAGQLYKPSGMDTTNALNDDNDEKLLNFIGKVTDKKDNGIKDRVITVMSKNQNGFFIDAEYNKREWHIQNTIAADGQPFFFLTG